MEAVAKAKLNTTMGRTADAPLLVKEEFSAPPPNLDLADLQKQAGEAKHNLRGMQSQVEMASF